MQPRSGTNASGHLDALDGMRAIAIGGVLLLHLDRAHFPGGAFGVDVFFVLSSYLITSLLLDEVARRGRIRFGAFYGRRFFRLYPALLLWLAAVAIPTALVVHEAGTIPWSTAGAFFYVNDFLEAWTTHVGASFDQSWSLAVEEQFYLLWPLALALMARRCGARSQRTIALALVVGSVAIWIPFGNYFLPTGHLVPLALGCWAAFWLAHGGASTRLAAILRDGRLAAAAIAVFVVALLYSPTGRSGQVLVLAVAVAATGLMLHTILAQRSWPSRVLASPLFRWIGVRSYGIYLYGLTLLILIPAVTHLPLHEVVPLDMVAIALVVGLSYRYVEAPLRARGRAWLARNEVTPSEHEITPAEGDAHRSAAPGPGSGATPAAVLGSTPG